MFFPKFGMNGSNKIRIDMLREYRAILGQIEPRTRYDQ